MPSRDFATNIDQVNPIQRDKVNNIVKYLAYGHQGIVRKIVLFGSSITDRATEESDIDIAIDFYEPEIVRTPDGGKKYARYANEKFISWVRFATEETGASIVDMEDLRTCPYDYCHGVAEAVASGVVIYEEK